MQYHTKKPGSIWEISVSVVDPVKFKSNRGQSIALHTPGFLPKCPRTTWKYLQKISYTYEASFVWDRERRSLQFCQHAFASCWHRTTLATSANTAITKLGMPANNLRTVVNVLQNITQFWRRENKGEKRTFWINNIPSRSTGENHITEFSGGRKNPPRGMYRNVHNWPMYMPCH